MSNTSFTDWANQQLNEGNGWEPLMIDLEKKITARLIRIQKANQQKEEFLRRVTEKKENKVESLDQEGTNSNKSPIKTRKSNKRKNEFLDRDSKEKMIKVERFDQEASTSKTTPKSRKITNKKRKITNKNTAKKKKNK